MSTAQGAPRRLSVVAASRNDDHGEGMLRRMQIFADGLAAQGERHGLEIELVLVEWNPPPDRPRLAEALDWPRSPSLSARIVHVPREVHEALPGSERLGMYEMLAKNVGLRRAGAPLVVSVNVDVVFSDPLAHALATSEFAQGAFYRAERVDVDRRVDESLPMDEFLQACETSIIRRHGAVTTVEVEPTAGGRRGLTLTASPRVTKLTRAVRHAPGALAREIRTPWRIPATVRRRWSAETGLHLNASGDFTMMSRDDWWRLRGYSELPLHGLQLDGLLLVRAYHQGLRQVILPGDLYHVDHGRWRPPDPTVEAGLDEAPRMSFAEYWDLAAAYARGEEPIPENPESWGLGDLVLDEITISASGAA